MFKFREEYGYFAFLVALTLLELLLAIPFMFPLFSAEAMNLYTIAGFAHILGLCYLLMKMVDIRPYGFHLAGVAGLLLSVLPYINFIYHLFVLILGCRVLYQYIKYWRTGQLPRKRQVTTKRDTEYEGDYEDDED